MSSADYRHTQAYMKFSDVDVSYQHQEPVKLLPFDKKAQNSSIKVKMTIFCYLSYITQNAIVWLTVYAVVHGY